MKPSLHFGSGSTLAGPALIIWSDVGIRVVRLLQGTTLAAELADLRRRNPGREIIEDAVAGRKRLMQIDGVLAGELAGTAIPLDLEGTPFQRKVWETLVRVPRGTTLSYQALAAKVKHPRAVRAVASACARNPICLLVPCHRVVRADGGLGGYYYGLERKRALLELEGAAV